MLYCGIILLSAVSLVLGNFPSPFVQPSDEDGLRLEGPSMPSVQSTLSSHQEEDEAEEDDVMGFCFLGSFPMAPCMIKCFWKNKSAYCDENANCRCGTREEEDDVDDVEESYRTPEEDFTTLQPDFDTEGGVMGVCYLGHIPSPSCMFRCSLRGKSAVCDEDSMCLCEDRTWRELIVPTNPLDRPSKSGQDLDLTENEPESDDDGSVLFYIFDLSGLFASENTTPEKEDPEKSCSPHELWTVPHIVAMAILTLVTVLLVLELALCCKRRYNNPCNQHLQTVFSSEVLEKGMVVEKPNDKV